MLNFPVLSLVLITTLLHILCMSLGLNDAFLGQDSNAYWGVWEPNVEDSFVFLPLFLF